MRVIPERGALGAPYWDALREHRIVVQECTACAALQHPPLPRCSHCLCSDLGWREMRPEGTVYTYAVVHQATHVAFLGEVPYAVGMIEIAEGVRLVAGLQSELSRLRIGMPVRAVFRDVSAVVTLLDFAPLPAAGPDLI